MVPPLITLEEHFLAKNMTAKTDHAHADLFKSIPGLEDKLRDVDTIRLEHMDAGKVAVQVISHGPIPGGPTIEESQNANKQLAEAVKRNHPRFAGFAALPMADPDAAAKELQRCIADYHFVGALIDCHIDGRYYDGEEYASFWQKVADLDVPVYIHPTFPAEDMAPRYTGNFSEAISSSLGASGWGWHNETALHILRLFASGLFDRHPHLKIIVGHMGEMLPFMLERIEQISGHWSGLKRPFHDVWASNIWITTSGFWSLNPMATILRNTAIDHILYSVDYPFMQNEDGLKWMLALEQSGMVTAEQLEMIAYRNAQTLLGIMLPK